MERITTPTQFFADLGELHDAKITEFEFAPSTRYIRLAIHDLNTNFVGLPEYKGLQPAVLFFRNVSSVQVNIDHLELEQWYIYEMSVNEKDDQYQVRIGFALEGSVDFRCSGIELEIKAG